MTLRRLFSILLLILPSLAQADLEFSNAWIRDLPATVPVRAGYMSIENTGDHKRYIISFQSDAFEKIEIHQTIEEDGLMRMQQLDYLLISAGKKLELQPGGIHLMLINPLREIKPGDEINIWVSFEYDYTETKKLTMTVRK